MKQSHKLLTTVMTALFLLMTAGAGATPVSRERAAAIAADVLGTQVTNSTTRLATPAGALKIIR